jgi:hypothetical protein
MKSPLQLDRDARPVYLHLEPIVALLLTRGNILSHEYRWGENRTGFFCHLKKPIDFALVEASFELPSFILLNRPDDSIECAITWATITGGVHSS